MVTRLAVRIQANHFTELLNFPRTYIRTTTILPSHPTSNAFNKLRTFETHHTDLPLTLSPENAILQFLNKSRKNFIVLPEIEIYHCNAIKAGIVLREQVGGALVNLYVRCRSLVHAINLFDEMSVRDVYIWTVLISCCSRDKHYHIGLTLAGQMVTEGVRPNRFTLSSVLKCCVGCNNLNKGKEVHGLIVRNGIEVDVALENSILDCYAKSGALQSAEKFFEIMAEKDFVSWNIMILGYLEIGNTSRSVNLFRSTAACDISTWNTIINGHMRNGFDTTALELFLELLQTKLRFNQQTFSIALTLSGRLAMLRFGRQIHGKILRNGIEYDKFIMNSLIDMYWKCGEIEKSALLFNTLSLCTTETPDLPTICNDSVAETISWSSMIAGYVENGRNFEALELFAKMLQKGNMLDNFTLTTAVSACSKAELLEQGRQLHACIEKVGHGSDVFLGSAITYMYSRCGMLKEAYKAFEYANYKNVVLYTSIIGAYASHGHGDEAIKIFVKMLQEKIVPNEISYLNVLSACSHSGLIEEGLICFRLMQEYHGLFPSIEHYSCMVDLYSRVGLINEAINFIKENNIGHHAAVWKLILSACRVHNNAEIANLASEKLVRIEPQDPSSYILMSSIYASKRQWIESAEVRNQMTSRRIMKQPGESWIK